MKNKYFLSTLLIFSTVAFASPEREQAKRLYSTLTGGTANKAIADKYEAKLKAEGPLKTAEDIIESGQGFYSATLSNFFSPTTNEDGSQFVDFNDMTATLIGITRDADGTTTYPGSTEKVRFFDVFYKNVMYQYDARDLPGRENTAFTLVRSDIYKSSGFEMPVRFCARNSGISPGAEAVAANCISREYGSDKYKARDHIYFPEFGVAIPEYNRTKNYHHKQLQEFNLPFSRRDLFVNRGQVPYTTIYDDAVAGMFSTRAFAAEYYRGGTNRTPFAFFARNFLCLEMEQINDTSIPDVYVRRDVDRKPGEVTETFKNSCVGCHAGQDPIANAFAYYDYDGETPDDGAMVYRDHKNPDNPQEIIDGVAPKINLNNNYSQGKPVVNDNWINLWNRGQNEYIGWGSSSAGNGAKSLGKMLSETKQVRSCLSKKVFESVCYKNALSELDKEVVAQYANDFDKDGNLKRLFAKMAVYCMGEK